MLWLKPWVIGIFLILQTCQISNKFNLFVQLLEQIVFLFNNKYSVFLRKGVEESLFDVDFCWVAIWLLSKLSKIRFGPDVAWIFTKYLIL